MAQKLWRVVRACVEMGPANPIQQIHDQGAGGNCNVVRTSLLCSWNLCVMHGQPISGNKCYVQRQCNNTRRLRPSLTSTPR